MPAERGAWAPLRVWCLLRDQEAYVRPVEACLGAAARFIYDSVWDPRALVSARPDIVVCVNDWPGPIARCLDAARAAGIPSLLLQDGILEWRCQYENPLFGAGGGAPQHQPVLADRIACIGEVSARHIAGWGNSGRVVVTGMPRLDPLLTRRTPPVRRPGTRLLVMTAKNPGFTEAQRALTLRSLRDLKGYLDAQPDLEVFWRISRGLVAELGVENHLRRADGTELAEQIATIDAVVTTPSTAMLEAMLLGRPVAALDYHNVPRFVPTAWTISAPEQIPQAVQGVLAPEANRLDFQRQCLEDSLRCDGPAAPRVAALMTAMAGGAPEEAGGSAPAQSPSSNGKSRPSLAERFPGQAVFVETDIAVLQARLARLQQENEALTVAQRARLGGSLHRMRRWLRARIARTRG